MQFIKKLFRSSKKQPASVFDSSSGDFEAQRWNGPKYVIGFPNKEKPFIPYYRIDNQNEKWIKAPSNGHLYYDPIEDCVEFKKISRVVDRVVDEELGERKNLFGACHRVWSIKKRILKEQYGIEWHSASDMNPTCRFD